MSKSVLHDLTTTGRAVAAATVNAMFPVGNWRDEVPVLVGSRVTLREVRLADARSLLAILSSEEVSRSVSPPPDTVEGFERFILWAQRERAAGTCICFAVVPHGTDEAVGLFQVRRLDARFTAAEWGFALGSRFWGTGVFMDAAQALLRFVFQIIGTHRLEARVVVANGRGSGAIRKLGAVPELVLRGAFVRGGEYLDQVLWTILDEDWRLSQQSAYPARVH